MDLDQTAPRSRSTLVATMTFKVTGRRQSRRQLWCLSSYGLRYPKSATELSEMNIQFLFTLNMPFKIVADDRHSKLFIFIFLRNKHVFFF